MASVNFNLSSLRARRFKGYLQMQDPQTPSNYLRLKERQTMNISLSFGRDSHYDDQGQKVLDPSGYTHQFSVDVKTSADMFDTGFTWNGFGGSNTAPTDQSSISYWIYKNQIYEPVELIFITTMETVASAGTSKYLHLKFTCDVNAFTPVTLAGATSDTSISGEILRIEAVKRSASATTLSG